MSYIVPKEIPNCCGRCPCFHAEHPMYCQAVKADKNKRIYAPYGEGRPDWCPLIEVPTPHSDRIEVGDEVIWTTDNITLIVTSIYKVGSINWCDGVAQDGKVYSTLIENDRKTGKHYDIQSILEAMRK